jgi:hypothetical protein
VNAIHFFLMVLSRSVYFKMGCQKGWGEIHL